MDARIVPRANYYEHWIEVKYADGSEICYEAHVENGSVLDFPRMEEAVGVEIVSTEDHDNDGYLIRFDRTRQLPNLQELCTFTYSISFEDFLWLLETAPLTSVDANIRFAVPGSYVFPQIDVAHDDIHFIGDGPYSVDFGDYSGGLNLHCNDNVRYIRALSADCLYIQGPFDVIEANIKVAQPNARGIVIGSVKNNYSRHITIYATRAEYEAVHGEIEISRAKGAAI